MNVDVIDLKAFYTDKLGRVAFKSIAARIRRQWPNVGGERLLGIGYAAPYLADIGSEMERRLAFMPAAQGVARWPADAPNSAALVADDMLPLNAGSLDRVLAIHCLEHAENPHDTLREVWRILAPGGRLLVVVPNRAGMWARAEGTPFGHGRPFSRGQLAMLMRETMFSPTAWSTALAMPPTKSRLFLHGGANWERLGLVFWRGFSGVWIVEATKLVHQKVEVRARQTRSRRVLGPALAPTAGL